jgi:hypothetical protein
MTGVTLRNRLASSVRSGRARGELFIASHRSLRRCTFSQKSGLLLKTRARISAVAAVTVRRLLHNSLTCLLNAHRLGQRGLRQSHRLQELFD